MKTVILTGFMPFGQYQSNLSEQVALFLDGKIIGDYRIASIIFAADIPPYNRGEEIFMRAQRIKASGIISLGIGSEKKGFCVELVARNFISNQVYCPELSGKPINDNRPIGEKLPLDLSPWNIPAFYGTCQDAGLVTEISDDCGGFCCNHLAYQVRLAQTLASFADYVPFIYMHIPCAVEDVSNPVEFAKQGKTTMDLETVTKGLTILLSNASL